MAFWMRMPDPALPETSMSMTMRALPGADSPNVTGSVAATGSPAELRERTGGPLHETFTDLLADPAAVIAGGGVES